MTPSSEFLAVAEHHAIIRAVGDECESEARQTTQPVLLNNRTVTRARLRHGDNVTIGRTVFVSVHQAEVFLPLDYPRRPPFCRMITPVFHPNIDPQKICLGDHWSAGQSLAQLAVLSSETVTTWAPSGLNCADRTGPLWCSASVSG